MITVGRVLYTYEGAYAGILLLDLDPFSLLRLDHEFVLARDKYGISVTISNTRQELVYHSDAASGRLSWQEVMESEARYVNGGDDEDNIVLTGSTTPGTLYVKTEIPRSMLLYKINQIQGVTTTIIVLSCLIITLISFALSVTITKPIQALRRSMKQAEAGQYLPIEKKQANDEIGSLVKSYNKMIVTIRNLINDVYIADIKQRQAKIVALQNQINPHMLYNTLESIRMKTMVKGDQESADMIKILSRMFRLALNKEGRNHSIRHELDYTTNYLKLQNIRYEQMFKLRVSIPEEILHCGIIPLVFQPIVENSIHHGFKDYNTPLIIGIEGLWTADGDILIRISDDGAGLSLQKQAELQALLEHAETDKYKLEQFDVADSHGIGLKNIAERIKLHYGDRYGLRVEGSFGQGTTVELLIPQVKTANNEGIRGDHV